MQWGSAWTENLILQTKRYLQQLNEFKHKWYTWAEGTDIKPISLCPYMKTICTIGHTIRLMLFKYAVVTMISGFPWTRWPCLTPHDTCSGEVVRHELRVKLSLALLWYGLYHSSWAPGCFTNNAHAAPVNIPWIFYSVILMTWVPLYDFPKVNQVTLRNMDTVHKDQFIRHIDVPVPTITNGMCAIKYPRKTHSRTTITHCM